ncbi:hypothetical protein COU54_04325 [Candidatus Pacearchaeota archaeon CG10_big_fil_rev_8_21_14_0_10_31_24]|nr:MAG: hypothetical protein COU54_04325 [Candidatus Pacearchaeota archaeon CG10_big_fil_rev_8_21_14_0_10_31_24]
MELGEKWVKLWEKGKGGVYQSWEWIVLQEKLSNKPIFLSIEDSKNGDFLAGICAFEKTLKTPLGEKKILTVRGSPIFLDYNSGAKVLENFKNESKKYFYGTIMPSVRHDKEALFMELGYKKVVNNTILIDLKKDKTELWKNLEKKSIRWGIKTGEKNGLIFKIAENELDVNAFYSMYSDTAKLGGFSAEKKEFIEGLRDSEISRLFLVYSNEKVVAGGLALIDKNNNILTLDLTGSNEEGLKLQAMPFIYWNILLYGMKNGLDIFDLGGYDAEARVGDKTYNINKFKERFGGEITEQPIFSSGNRYPILRKVISKIRIVKKFYKKSD